MDVKLSVAIGDDATAKIVSDNLGRKYVEREGWGRQTGLLFGKQASSGRFELMPLMGPGSVQRLDDNNTILQIRSGYGAILNKLNFYSDARFIARRREVQGWKRELVVPEVTIRGEWPLFKPRPPEATVESAAVQAMQPQHETIDHEMIVLEKARAVFVDPTRLMHFYRSAIAQVDDQPTADLLFRLRTAPETIGDLKGKKSRSVPNARRQREQALASVWPLRKAISEGRWAVIGERLSDRAEREELAFLPYTRSSTTDYPATDESETERLDLGFSSAQHAVDQVAGIAENAVRSEHVNDPNALMAALAIFKGAFEHSMTEFEEENTLLFSS